MKIKTPCLKCESRHIGCHSKCKIYNDFKIDLAELNETIRKDKESKRMTYACENRIKKI